MSAHAKFWTPVEDEIVSDLSMTAREAANQLPNRTECAVKVRRTSKGLNRIATRKKWSAEEVEYVLSHGEMTDYELAKKFGVHNPAIKAIRRRNGVPKTHKCIECGADIGSKGKYCKDHKTLGRQIRYYKNRVKNRQGNLTEEDICSLLKGACDYCGSEVSLGIDRVDSSKTYTKDNAVSCCSKCNVMKMDLHVDDWMEQMKKILEHNNGK